MAHKSGRQFFGIGVREKRISMQDDAEDGYNHHHCVTLNFGNEFYGGRP